MLERMGPEQFEERMAHHMLEPWGDDWRRAGVVAAMIWNAALLQMGLFKDPPGALSPSECIPHKTLDSDRPEAPLPDPVAFAARAQELYG